MVIGLALTAIAAGTWAGGRIADRVAPRPPARAPARDLRARAVALTPSSYAARRASGDPGLLLIVATLSILVPGALLSAVTPVVIKLRLTSLDQTGSVVGHLSGVGTVGAIVGTVVTGFVLDLAGARSAAILVGLGVAAGRRRSSVEVLPAPPAAATSCWPSSWRWRASARRSRRAAATSRRRYHCLAITADPDPGRADPGARRAAATRTSTSTTRRTSSSPTCRRWRR